MTSSSVLPVEISAVGAWVLTAPPISLPPQLRAGPAGGDGWAHQGRGGERPAGLRGCDQRLLLVGGAAAGQLDPDWQASKSPHAVLSLTLLGGATLAATMWVRAARHDDGSGRAQARRGNAGVDGVRQADPRLSAEGLE